MVTHDPQVAAYADRRLHLVDGQLVGAASPRLPAFRRTSLSGGVRMNGLGFFFQPAGITCCAAGSGCSSRCCASPSASCRWWR